MSTVSEPITTDVVIVSAGRCGLFQVFELGRFDPRAHVIDALPIIGGQYAELYPNKPIYNIPRLSHCRRQGADRTAAGADKPFSPVFHRGQQVQEVTPVNAPGEPPAFRLVTTAARRTRQARRQAAVPQERSA